MGNRRSQLITFAALALWVSCLALGALGGCGSQNAETADGGGTKGPPPEGGLILNQSDGNSSPDGEYNFDVEPTGLQTITVALGQTSPTVAYTATLNGAPASATWSVDRGDLGSIGAGPSSKGTFQPTGTTGGLATIRVSAMGVTVQRQVFVKINGGTQNGANGSAAEAPQVVTSLAQLGAGGGVGGVGGEGLGGPVTSTATQAALSSPSQSGQAEGMTFLYPYDQTVFPRGMLAPLLQWTWNPPDGGTVGVDAIQIRLQTTSGSFSWTGNFSPPSILQQSGGAFIRHPIPQDVWTTATNTAGGPTPSGALDNLTVSLVVAEGGHGFGPISETWIVAPGLLEGTVYYNSYGTALVKNSLDSDYNNNEYGAAVLGIEQGATGPTVVAGYASPPGAGTGCRVCHVVASGGSRLIAQHGDNYDTTSTYDLKNANAETVLTGNDSLFGWAGLYPDGTLAFTSAADLAAGTPNSQLYAFPPAGAGAQPLPLSGVPANLQAGTPAFSPDGQHLAFGLVSGALGAIDAGAASSPYIVAMDFTPPGDAGAATASLSNPKVLVTMPSGERAGFPTWFPTNDAIAFHYQITNSNHEYNTWHGAEAQIWWSDLATGTATVLGELNGIGSNGQSYLPTGPNNHLNLPDGGPPIDTILNYEPTVSPISSGGYIWVIFTSRRLYGNVATTDPWQSDPRNYDATQVANATTKKLWVAAIDLNAKAGTDPSHPAFYLPAQELLAGNMRGFWVLNPCLADSMGCTAGDQCCSGYCRSVEGTDAGLTCMTIPPLTMTCSQVGEHCTTSADCCDPSNACVDNFCAIPTPQ